MGCFDDIIDVLQGGIRLEYGSFSAFLTDHFFSCQSTGSFYDSTSHSNNPQKNSIIKKAHPMIHNLLTSNEAI
jgi:hypothetical protein